MMKRSEDFPERDRLQLADILARFFKDEPKKIALWLLTPNPLFGYISPCELIALGRGSKVLKFAKSAVQGEI